VGAGEGAGCFGAAYEYLFNVAHQLRKAGLKSRVKLTYVTPEPMLGHFGIGGLPHGEAMLGMFMRKEHIASKVDTAIDHVDEGRLVLADGTGLDFAYAMIIPPFLGQDVIAQVKGEAPQAHKTFGDIPAVCVMDAGNNGVLILADKMLPPRKHAVLIPGPQNHLMKVAFEK
jgi:sulfide:quinone oxidoreductase